MLRPLVNAVIMHLLYFDACCGIAHLATAGTATHRKPALQLRLLPDKDVSDFARNPSSSVQGDGDPACADFQADKMLARTSERYDITGVGAAFCRHGFVIMMLNLTTGERWSYSTMMLSTMLTVGILPMFWWYDINCRYQPHAVKWATTCAATLGARATFWVANVMGFPLPTWHHHMHNASCQAKNSSRTKKWAGRGVGEPPEQAWAAFRRAGHLLQYASLAWRGVALERIMQPWNRRPRPGSVARPLRTLL